MVLEKTRLGEWLHCEYEIATAALQDLGLPEEIKRGTRKGEIFGQPPAIDELHDRLSTVGISNVDLETVELVLYPSVSEIGVVDGGHHPKSLTGRYDRGQASTSSRTFVTAVEWNMGQHSRIHDIAGLLGQTGIHVSLSVETTPAGNPGLTALSFCGQSLDEQRQALESHAEYWQNRGTELLPITISQIVMINARRRLEGRPLLDDSDTRTRLAHYPLTRLAGPPTIPAVYTRAGRMFLDGDGIGAKESSGVRQTIIVP